MDSAVYESTTQKIFGVRGQWLFQFNATSGALEQSARFAKDVTGSSSITVLAGNIYVGTSYVPSSNLQSGTPYPDVDIYKVGAADFVANGAAAAFSALGLGTKNNYSFAHPLPSGFRALSATGSLIYGFNDGQGLFSVDPTNVLSFLHVSSGFVLDTAVDTTNGVIWVADPNSPDVWAWDNALANDCFDTNGNMHGVCGVTFNVAQNKAYAVDGTFQIWSIPATGHFPAFTNFTGTHVSTGRINANPIRIKSVNNQAGNPHNGKVLIPTWNDDAVVVWNPLTDTVDSVQTGFTAPIDVVPCPTTNWAVQSGTVGLKQIT